MTYIDDLEIALKRMPPEELASFYGRLFDSELEFVSEFVDPFQDALYNIISRHDQPDERQYAINLITHLANSDSLSSRRFAAGLTGIAYHISYALCHTLAVQLVNDEDAEVRGTAQSSIAFFLSHGEEQLKPAEAIELVKLATKAN